MVGVLVGCTFRWGCRREGPSGRTPAGVGAVKRVEETLFVHVLRDKNPAMPLVGWFASHTPPVSLVGRWLGGRQACAGQMTEQALPGSVQFRDCPRCEGRQPPLGSV